MLGSKLWGAPSPQVAKEFFSVSDRFGPEFFAAIEPKELLGPTALVEMIIAAREAKKPSSFIRMGDGEGNLLLDHVGLDAGMQLKAYCVDRISYIHFGDKYVTARAGEEFLNFIVDAVESADVIGIVGAQSIQSGFTKPEEEKDVRGIMGQRASAALALKYKNLTDIWFNRSLLDRYDEIIGGQDIVLISSYPQLSPILAKAFKATVDLIEVPTQAVFHKPSERVDTKHYPDAMNRIVNQIDPLPGQIFLVAAGLLGKMYSSLVKARGGIAIDIGSVPEIWLGIPARGLSADYIAKWRLPDS